MNAAFLNNVILKYSLQFSRLEELISGIRGEKSLTSEIFRSLLDIYDETVRKNS